VQPTVATSAVKTSFLMVVGLSVGIRCSGCDESDGR
jgi:hypothetical protein